MYIDLQAEHDLLMLRLERQALERAKLKVASQQLGEAFIGLEQYEIESREERAGKVHCH